MSTEIVPINPALLEMIRTGKGLTPFSQEIMVLDTKVAGTSHKNVSEFVGELSVGEFFLLRREPNNTFDSFAVSVLTKNNRQVGYIPKNQNEIISRLMDAGKLFVAKLESISNELNDSNEPIMIKHSQSGELINWIRLNIKVYLKE